MGISSGLIAVTPITTPVAAAASVPLSPPLALTTSSHFESAFDYRRLFSKALVYKYFRAKFIPQYPLSRLLLNSPD